MYMIVHVRVDQGSKCMLPCFQGIIHSEIVLDHSPLQNFAKNPSLSNANYC